VRANRSQGLHGPRARMARPAAAVPLGPSLRAGWPVTREPNGSTEAAARLGACLKPRRCHRARCRSKAPGHEAAKERNGPRGARRSP